MKEQAISALSLVLLLGSSALGARLHVKPDGSDANDGTTWVLAYKTIERALDQAELLDGEDEIWVAEGVYKPSDLPGRAASFRLRHTTEVFGGFVGDEIDRSERDVRANETILHGDLSGDDPPVNPQVPTLASIDVALHQALDDNAYHVVQGPNPGEDARIDGFLITRGIASSEGVPNDTEGGGARVFARVGKGGRRAPQRTLGVTAPDGALGQPRLEDAVVAHLGVGQGQP